jgi:hypothetical protein
MAGGCIRPLSGDRTPLITLPRLDRGILLPALEKDAPVKPGRSEGGVNGVNGTDGMDGMDGMNGVNGMDGMNGVNGMNGLRI